MGAPCLLLVPLDNPLVPQVVPKVEVLRRDTLKQCKEEVSIQVRVDSGSQKGFGVAVGMAGGHQSYGRRVAGLRSPDSP